MARCNCAPSQNVVVEVLEATVLEYEKQIGKLRKELEGKALVEELKRKLKEEAKLALDSLLDCILRLLQTTAKLYQNANVSVLLQKLFRLNARDDHGNTLLHIAAKGRGGSLSINDLPPFDPCIETMKLLLNAGFSVNAINNSGDTPLHRAVTYKPSNDKIHLLCDMLEVLLDGGAHHDFINNDGKTAFDLARTDEARRILSEKRKLELKCIAAKAVKTFGLPYLGMVPQILEKDISMH